MPQSKKSFALLELCIVIAVISILTYIMLKRHTNKALNNPEAEKIFKEDGIDSSSYQALSHSLKNKVNGINQQTKERNKAIEGI